MTSEPNPLRCETCENTKCIWNHENPHAYSGRFPKRKLTLAAQWANNFMCRVGCASHSSHQSERDKILSLLERVHTILKGVHTDVEDKDHWRLLKDVTVMKKELHNINKRKIHEPICAGGCTRHIRHMSTESKTSAHSQPSPGSLAKCADCGATLIAPDDGKPYWCIECSQKREERRR
jgi:ribosomal protein S27E